jgi:hypothetical protein
VLSFGPIPWPTSDREVVGRPGMYTVVGQGFGDGIAVT